LKKNFYSGDTKTGRNGLEKGKERLGKE